MSLFLRATRGFGGLAGRVVPGPALLLALAGPAFAGSASPSADYARAVTTVQMRSAELEQLLAETRDRVAQLEEVIRNQGQSEVARADDLGSVREEVTGLRGRVEVLEFKLAEVRSAVEALRLADERRLLHAESRLRQVETLLGARPPPPPTDADLGIVGVAPTAPAPPVSGLPSEASAPVLEDPALPATTGDKLDLAVQHMQAGRHVAARAVLKEAIASGAGAPELAELRYRYAETFANTGEHAAAISEFDKVTKEFPRSDWACWSYYRTGESFDKLGKSGKSFYQGATEGACAKSEAAKEAKKKL